MSWNNLREWVLYGYALSTKGEVQRFVYLALVFLVIYLLIYSCKGKHFVVIYWYVKFHLYMLELILTTYVLKSYYAHLLLICIKQYSFLS